MIVRGRVLFPILAAALIIAACGTPVSTEYELVVSVAGSGSGSVVSNPAGIDTGAGDDSAVFAAGTEVTLTATAASGSSFVEFTPADTCGAGSGANTCVVTMDAAKEVTATFGVAANETLTVAVSTGSGAQGVVTSDPAGIDTGTGDFSAPFAVGTVIELTATASTGAFAGWTGGACDGLKTTTCTLTLGIGEPTVTANFNAVETLTLRGAAGGDDAVEFLGDSDFDAVKYPEGWVWANFPRLDLGYDPDHNFTKAAFRFPNVSVPSGSVIQSAVLTLTAYPEAAGSGAMTLTLRGEASANASGFTQDPDANPSFAITERTLTTASETWNILDGAWAGNTQHSAPDAADVLQEIVDQLGWAGGNAVVLTLRGDGVTVMNRRVYTFEGTADVDRRPTLVIQYVALP